MQLYNLHFHLNTGIFAHLLASARANARVMLNDLQLVLCRDKHEKGHCASNINIAVEQVHRDEWCVRPGWPKVPSTPRAGCSRSFSRLSL